MFPSFPLTGPANGIPRTWQKMTPPTMIINDTKTIEVQIKGGGTLIVDIGVLMVGGTKNFLNGINKKSGNPISKMFHRSFLHKCLAAEHYRFFFSLLTFFPCLQDLTLKSFFSLDKFPYFYSINTPMFLIRNIS